MEFGKRVGKHSANRAVLYFCSALMGHRGEVASCAIPFFHCQILNNGFTAAKLVTGSIPEDGWNKINNRKRSTYK